MGWCFTFWLPRIVSCFYSSPSLNWIYWYIWRDIRAKCMLVEIPFNTIMDYVFCRFCRCRRRRWRIRIGRRWKRISKRRRRYIIVGRRNYPVKKSKGRYKIRTGRKRWRNVKRVKRRRRRRGKNSDIELFEFILSHASYKSRVCYGEVTGSPE